MGSWKSPQNSRQKETKIVQVYFSLFIHLLWVFEDENQIKDTHGVLAVRYLPVYNKLTVLRYSTSSGVMQLT